MKSHQCEIAVRVHDLSKCFKVYGHPKQMILEYVLGTKRHEEFWALKDINVEIGRGEVIGLIGRNGSGKSTLLRILTGVLDYTAGSVSVNGNGRTGRTASTTDNATTVCRAQQAKS